METEDPRSLLKGLGAVIVATVVWTAVFVAAPALPAAQAAPPATQEWLLRNVIGSGPPHRLHVFGGEADAVFVGDWDGDGSDTVGVRRGHVWLLSNDVDRPRVDLRFSFGRSGDTPLVGDWNGDGVDTIGVRRGQRWFLRNRNSRGPHHELLGYGRASDTPLVGDWNGDGVDTVGVRRGRLWLLRDENRPGRPDVRFRLGRAQDTPLVGDWDGDGDDDPGLRRGNGWLLNDSPHRGAADHAFRYGRASDAALIGNWGGRGGDGIGVARPLQPLRAGMRGPQVRRLQRELRAHHYWVGPVDGVFGTLTKQAVWAFEKVQGRARDGEFSGGDWRALQRPRRPRSRSNSGLVMEVDERRQLLLMMRGGRVQWIFNTSTGTNDHYTSGGRRYLAETPNGRWRIYRQIDDWRVSHLGRLYRPKYFHTDGIAIHGHPSVPPQPVSHGCVRVSMDAMDWLWPRLPLGTDVWVYGGPVF